LILGAAQARVKLTVIQEPRRIMALDINSRHEDFAIAEKTTLKPVAFGKVNCSKMVNAKRGKKRIRTHSPALRE